MIRFGRAVVKHRTLVLILAVLLLIPSVLGMANTRINYDMLDYLPEDMDTVIGQNVLLEDFGKGAFSFVIVQGMSNNDVAQLKENIEQVDHVATVLWYSDLMDVTVPREMLPQKYCDAFNAGDETLMAVFFDTSTSADETMEAITAIRRIAGKQCFVSGMSALVTDLKDLSEREEPIYVGLAVLCACVMMVLLLDSWLVPFLFLLSIGMAILYNMGTNYFLGEISYITKALAAVLQLAVTMDYSIFLWHSYSEAKRRCADRDEAMAQAVASTITSVVGSSLTTIAGFLAMCFMSYTMGLDLGIVMAKGVLLGVIGSVTILPALLRLFDKPLDKTRHKPLIPSMQRTAAAITKRSWVFLLAFVVLLVPAVIGYRNTPVYYDFTNLLSSGDADLNDDMPFLEANDRLVEDFDVASTHMILADANLSHKDTKAMLDSIEALPGVKYALGLDSLQGSMVPKEMLPEELLSTLESDRYKLILVNSEYRISTDECNEQIDSINAILKEYDPQGMLIGEAPCTKDLIEVTNHDFEVVNIISIAAIFIIIALTLKSISLPVILVAVIEFSIFINLGIPYYTGNALAFITPICISTIQLGATVDYAILMTTRYKAERRAGCDKRRAVTTALAASIPSILVSALGFFAATFGVAVYSNISLISSMCHLMARGAIVSMFSVMLVLPSLLMLLDKVVCHTTAGMRPAAHAQAAQTAAG